MRKSTTPLTATDVVEKERLNMLYRTLRPVWERRNNGKKLSQARLGQIIGEMISGEPISQGAVWAYLSV